MRIPILRHLEKLCPTREDSCTFLQFYPIFNILFKNISLFGAPGKYTIELKGADEKHIVSGVTMNNVSILGNPLTKKSTNLKIGNYVYKFKVE